MDKMPITPNGFQFLQDELKRLKNEERPKIIKMIEFARSLGDLSENAEYETAKDRQAFNDKRINELESKLSSCVVIDPSKIKDKTKLLFGLSFEIEDLDTGEKKTYQLLGPEESNPEKRVSTVTISDCNYWATRFIFIIFQYFNKAYE